MKYELSIYKLGELLKKLEDNYKLDLLIKRDLSGGWMTITGVVKIEQLPSLNGGCNGKGSNILGLKLLTDKEAGTSVKLTGSKTKTFNVEIAPTKYKEISKKSVTLNQIKINENECKLRIDDDMIFTIKAKIEDIEILFN